MLAEGRPPGTFLNKSTPRNQRYLQPRSFGAGLSCEVDQGCELAVQRDLKLPSLGYEPDFFDQFVSVQVWSGG